MSNKLEIGPGENPVGTAEGGWVHAGFEVKWGFQALPFADNTFDEVYASHVLEHVPWQHTAAALEETLRILKPGGELEIWVPDFAYIVECWNNERCGDKWRRFNPEGDFMKWVNGRIFTYGPGESNWHHACFDAGYLVQVLQQAGFNRACKIVERSRGTSHGPIDLGVRGYK